MTLFGRIRQTLRLCYDSRDGHFRLYFGLRNPREGRGLGLMGVEAHDGETREDIVCSYADALDNTYAKLAAAGWREPKTDSKTRRIPVYLFDTTEYPYAFGNAFTNVHRGVSFLGLPSENGEPTVERKLLRARIDATHETTHVFTHRHRPIKSPLMEGWQWFDEATAVFIERTFCPDNPESLRFSRHWCHCPELALNAARGYHAGWFLEYLASKFDFGRELIRDIWHKARREERPADALVRLLRDRDLLFAGATVPDLFSRYCVETYSRREFAGEVFERFGERSVAESWIPRPGARFCLTGKHHSLAPLACRYYHMHLEAPAAVIVSVGAPPRHNRESNATSLERLKTALFLVAQDGKLSPPAFLGLAPGPRGVRNARLQGALEVFPESSGHVILMVANVDLPSFGYPVVQQYSVEVQVS